jgi:DNA invertase Pin-like site-specific DNA recombinase
MSTPKQLKGDSLRRQLEASRAYAEQHGLALDDKFDFQDLGVSAFKGDNAVTGALSRFMNGIDTGAVAPGSYLLVESLDRLSRQRVGAAMSLFLSIVERGISVVTLSDGNVYRPGSSDPMPLIQSLLIMSRAHEESQIKSQRLAAAWEQKRLSLGETKMSAICPKWMKLSDDRKSFVLLPERAAVIGKIFDWAAAGLGHFSICKRLNAEGVKPFGRAGGWGESYVEKILKNRAVIGEFHPHKVIDGRRVPEGKPVAGYYPEVISEDLFLSVQASRRARSTGAGGRRGHSQTNLFTHIAKCMHCGGSMRMVNKGKLPKGGRYLRCSNALIGNGCTASGWRYDSFEKAFLIYCSETDLPTILNADLAHREALERAEKRMADEERLAQAEGRRERIYALLDTTVDAEFLTRKLNECAIEIKDIQGRLAQTTEAPQAPNHQSIDEWFRLFRTIRQSEAPDHVVLRTKLAGKLRQIVRTLHLAPAGQPDLPIIEPQHEFAWLNHRLLSDTSVQGHAAFRVSFTSGMTTHVTVEPGDGSDVVRLVELPVGAGPRVTWPR